VVREPSIRDPDRHHATAEGVGGHGLDERVGRGHLGHAGHAQGDEDRDRQPECPGLREQDEEHAERPAGGRDAAVGAGTALRGEEEAREDGAEAGGAHQEAEGRRVAVQDLRGEDGHQGAER
jgi:hypothetical protein